MASSEQSTELITRKERRYQAREAQILRVARSLLREYGLTALTMDRIADAIDYSTPVVYQHFPCKEEIVLALAVQSALIRLKLHERVLQFKGNPRELIIASGEATVVLQDHLQCELLILTDALSSKISEERLQFYHTAMRRTIVMASTIVEDAVAAGDLTLPEDLSPEAFTFSLWATTFGGLSLLSTGTGFLQTLGSSRGRRTPENIQLGRMFGRALLDAYGWRPLSTEWDYRETVRRIYREVYPPELVEGSVLYDIIGDSLISAGIVDSLD
jgi:AcrR family transcriptional regulator